MIKNTVIIKLSLSSRLNRCIYFWSTFNHLSALKEIIKTLFKSSYVLFFVPMNKHAWITCRKEKKSLEFQAILWYHVPIYIFPLEFLFSFKFKERNNLFVDLQNYINRPNVGAWCRSYRTNKTIDPRYMVLRFILNGCGVTGTSALGWVSLKLRLYAMVNGN